MHEIMHGIGYNAEYAFSLKKARKHFSGHSR